MDEIVVSDYHPQQGSEKGVDGPLECAYKIAFQSKIIIATPDSEVSAGMGTTEGRNQGGKGDKVDEVGQGDGECSLSLSQSARRGRALIGGYVDKVAWADAYLRTSLQYVDGALSCSQPTCSFESSTPYLSIR